MVSKFLKSKEVREIISVLDENYGFNSEIPGVVFCKENDIFIITREAALAEIPRVNSMGLYIGEFRNGKFRFSIEGSQILGPKCNKNILELPLEESRAWIRGEDIPTNATFSGFVIVKHASDFMGCGLVKDGKLLNYVPKPRRLLVQA